MMETEAWYPHGEALVKGSEALCLHVYPDPRSPLGKALVARHGPNICTLIGTGRRTIDDDLRQLNGAPWTIGWGQTGKDITAATQPWSRQHAEARFRQSMAMFWAAVRKTWPGADRLHPRAQAALVSCGYNRGLSLTKKADDPLDTRREMREMRAAVLVRDYAQMAALFRSMKRIWEGEGMGGLITRREAEAVLCEQAAQGVP